MTGTKVGGRKCAETNFKKYGQDFYQRIGRKGGTNSTGGGFASEKIGKDGLTGPERARIAGAKGGFKSRRGPAALYLKICERCGCMTKTYAGRCLKCGCKRPESKYWESH